MQLFVQIVLVILSVCALFIIVVVVFMRSKTFGKKPSGARQERIQKSVNFKEGVFRNLTYTDATLKNVSYVELTWKFLNKPKNTKPEKPIPSIRTDLKALKSEKPTIVWFGHSSYLINYQSLNILIDPVFSGYASPASWLGTGCFEGANTYSVDDMPEIDLLILTHDHYDHLDYETITKLKGKFKQVYTSLGVGAHLEHWGVEASTIHEFDWWEKMQFNADIELIATPARHFSGRSFARATTLWSSFVLKLHGYSIFIGGDSGYESHFRQIGQQYGPFDISLLECGQYGVSWPYIHMFPFEIIDAAKDLNTKVLMPVHWGKFALALHPWQEPINEVVKLAERHEVNLCTPMIGQPVVIGEKYPVEKWWRVFNV